MISEQYKWHLRRELVVQRYLKLFSRYPLIDALAGSYWSRIERAQHDGVCGIGLLNFEKQVCSEIVMKLVGLLADLPIFNNACEQSGVDVLDQAFEEALVILEHFPDVFEIRKAKRQ